MNLKPSGLSEGRMVSVNRPISTQLFSLSESLSEALFELHFPLLPPALFIIHQSCLPLLQGETQGFLDQPARDSGTFITPKVWGSSTHPACQVSAYGPSARGSSAAPLLLPTSLLLWEVRGGSGQRSHRKGSDSGIW